MSMIKKQSELPAFVLVWPLGAALLLMLTPYTVVQTVQDIHGNAMTYDPVDLLSLVPLLFLYAIILVTTILITVHGKHTKLTWPLFVSFGLFALRFIFSQTAFLQLRDAFTFDTIMRLNSVVNFISSILQLVFIGIASFFVIRHIIQQSKPKAIGSPHDNKI